MIPYQLLTGVAQSVIGKAPEDVVGVSTDSRLPIANHLFIPLVGERFDAHDFLHDAIKQGATAIFWQADHPLPDINVQALTVYVVKDTLTALQTLAKQYRQTLSATVIGITGSNGKTSTKDLIGAVAKVRGKTHLTKGNLNNHIGLPLTILSAPQDTAYLVLEMGMSNFGEIKQLSEIASPDIAVITNIGESHIEFLKTREGIAIAKLEIIAGLKSSGVLIYDGDEPLLKQSYYVKTRTVGFLDGSTDGIHVEALTLERTTFRDNVHKQSFTIPLIGQHHAKNAMYAVLIGREIGLTDALIQQGFNQLTSTGMRFEQEEWNGHLLINDAYNASPTSMKAAIKIIQSLSDPRQKVLVLGDMYELGEQSDDYHRAVGKVIEAPIDYVLTVGQQAKHIADDTKVTHRHVETLVEAKTLLKQLKKPSVILFKASRGMRLETLIQQLKA
ncbi:UDP-N-acetylmuramoyl-tripeptide--D-alanyl-D-alanine ligase [Halolactibacillus halophilus]|uniref:UDP-N-acetylmuramoyl-tripeptide--D-alanyl-D-alanine ligase n=1 Tax=Halolactibacillus halophilus TaxID=306540 RepID=A0A1I5LR97_9BACI|nr:UDP-N-acetylmuramoyl-tripeptide--D-alanyl-D-alanine ligase [Halolactibacillus halophilus]GEM00689.1 UDP-N-acetylmuramoyl-tripeptide--D-alanyl-D-alanine ligase [Halolactibacillus halophilus]SFO99869.1 UDP-N-acetylmuramoyl-tripeptide--D-alanyl-D-alanine ligase [Halolactibacillus halophilus]